MRAWREQLRSRPGSGRLRRGWRLSRGGWRLLLQERPVRELALGIAALAVALLAGWLLALRGIGPGGRAGDYTFLEIAAVAVGTLPYFFLFAALCSAADASVDGSPIDIRDALLDAREKLGPLLIWSLLWLGAWVLLEIVVHSVPTGVVAVAWFGWTYLTAFTIPALVLETDSVASALGASLRTMRYRLPEAFAGFLRILLFTWLAALTASIAIGGAARHHLLPALLLLAFSTLVGGLAGATSQAFALLLYRDATDDLPAAEALPPKPRRRRRTVALRIAGAIVALLLVLFVIGRLTHRREHHTSGDGYSGAAYPKPHLTLHGR